LDHDCSNEEEARVLTAMPSCYASGKTRIPQAPSRTLFAASSGESGSRTYWRLRQTALGLNTYGAILEPDEIVLYEKLGLIYGCPIHEVVDIIPRDKTMKPTNDFLWLTRGGIPTEIKSPTVGDYEHAERLIWKAVTKAAKQDVIKDTFIVNYGVQALADGTLELLAAYNNNHSTGNIEELWVLTRDVLSQAV